MFQTEYLEMHAPNKLGWRRLHERTIYPFEALSVHRQGPSECSGLLSTSPFIGHSGYDTFPRIPHKSVPHPVHVFIASKCRPHKKVVVIFRAWCVQRRCEVQA